MIELLTAKQMRDVETAAIESGAASGLALMERAGRGVSDAIFEAWPDLAGGDRHAVVLCGPGNNGGDGFVIARRLRDRGWRVEVLLAGDPERLPPDARKTHDVWSRMGEVRPLTLEDAGTGARPDLLVDAMFGTGLTRPIPAGFAAAFHAVRARATTSDRQSRACRIVAVDCPSGLDCDTGEVLAEDAQAGGSGDGEGPLFADLTATFHRAKLGHYLARGPGLCGMLKIVDIGLRQDDPGQTPLRRPADRVRVVGGTAEDADAARWPSRLVLPGGGHKYDRGHALVLAGGPGRGGAARLAARAALRVGAGLVTVGCPPAALQENAAHLDAIMLRPLKEVTDLIELLADGRISSVCLGPGLGRGTRAQQMVTAVLAAERATVLDADALTTYEDDPHSLFYQLHDRCVLTPHEGEFARLFPDLGHTARGRSRISKVDAARRAADRAGCTVLLKGPDTVIASPGGAASLSAAVHGREAPWLGTAGAGDVLAGMIAGLLARTERPDDVHPVTEAAAWLHVEASRSFGPGLVAEDLPEELPRVFRAIGL